MLAPYPPSPPPPSQVTCVIQVSHAEDEGEPGDAQASIGGSLLDSMWAD